MLRPEALARETWIYICNYIPISIPCTILHRDRGSGHTIDRVALDTNVLDTTTAADLLGDGVAAHEGLGVAAGGGGAVDYGCGGGEGEGEEGEEV